MPKIKFNKATAEGPVEEEGVVAHLKVGEKKHKFIIHGEGDLSDYRTGMGVGRLNEAKIRAMVRYGSHCIPTDRKAAQDTIDFITAKVGIAKVTDELAKHPTLNGAA